MMLCVCVCVLSCHSSWIDQNDLTKKEFNKLNSSSYQFWWHHWHPRVSCGSTRCICRQWIEQLKRAVGRLLLVDIVTTGGGRLWITHQLNAFNWIFQPFVQVFVLNMTGVVGWLNLVLFFLVMVLSTFFLFMIYIVATVISTTTFGTHCYLVMMMIVHNRRRLMLLLLFTTNYCTFTLWGAHCQLTNARW